MANGTKILSHSGKEFTIAKKSVAHINPDKCVNCGTCREYCPVEAIEEQQRIICRVCPECTDRPALEFNAMCDLATEKACTTACPLGISPQGYVNLLRTGKKNKAFELIWDKNPLPSVCGRICTHPCEQACKRGLLVDEPIAIRGIKRYLSDFTDFVPEPYPERFEEEIAVIGAGPAGLTAAHYLAKAGYPVTIFDEDAEAGGMLQRGIPEFRLPREVLKKDIKRLEDSGIKFELGQKITKRRMEELRKEFDAILIATGAGISKELKVPGYKGEGVMTAMNFMEHANNHQSVRRHPGQVFIVEGAKVVVIGGGAVAIDTARMAFRYGASSVDVFCVEQGEDVPCHRWEIEEAEAEGVVMHEGWAPIEYYTEHNTLKSGRFAKVTEFSKTEDGKVTFKTDETEITEAECDYLIVAVGQGAETFWDGFKGEEGVYFAGDAKTGTTSVVDAMASGKKAAQMADADLRGREIRDPLDLRVLYEADLMQKIYPTNRLKVERAVPETEDPLARKNNFREVDHGYCDDDIITETMRCLNCGYQKVDPDKCIGCEVCSKVCPAGDVITMVALDGGENNA